MNTAYSLLQYIQHVHMHLCTYVRMLVVHMHPCTYVRMLVVHMHPCTYVCMLVVHTYLDHALLGMVTTSSEQTRRLYLEVANALPELEHTKQTHESLMNENMHTCTYT